MAPYNKVLGASLADPGYFSADRIDDGADASCAFHRGQVAGAV